MPKNSKNKKSPSNFGGLFIQKREDSKGRNYFVDREGKRRSSFEYSLQWSKSGRVSKDSFQKALQISKEEEITDISEGRLIADDFEMIRKARPLRKRELEIMETGTDQIFWQSTSIMNEAIKGGAEIRILKPDGDKFRKVSELEAMEYAQRFKDSVADSLDEIKEASETSIDSPLIRFNYEHDVVNNVFYFDFRNLTGFDNYNLLNSLISDNFNT